MFIIFVSYQSYIIKIIRAERDYEAEFLDIKYSDAKEIKKDENIKEVSITYNMGTAIEDFVEIPDNYSETIKMTASVKVNLTAYDKNAIKNNKIKLIEGRFPENSSEIVISDSVKLMKHIAIGEEIELTINGTKNKYHVVGRAEKLNNDYQAPLDITFRVIVGALTYFDEQEVQDNAKVDILINTNDISKISTTVNNLVSKLDLYETEQEKSEKVIYNRTLLNYNLVNYEGKENKPIISKEKGNSEDFEEDITKIAICMISIISISSIVVIYTSFKITYWQRIKEIGVLASIGMDKKQRRNMLLKEGIILGSIGIVLGTIAGTVMSAFIIQIIDIIFKKIGLSVQGASILIDANIKFSMIIPFKSILLSSIITYIITIISSILPIKRINKMSPIEAIRDVKNRKINIKQMKTPKIVKILFNQEGELAYKNIRREKSKYKAIVVSIVISIVLFISVNAMLENYLGIYGQNIDIFENRKEYSIDIPNNGNQEKIEKELLAKLENDNLIDNYIIVKQINRNGTSQGLELISTEKVSKKAKEIYKHINYNLEENKKVGVFIAKGTEYNEILKQAGVNEIGLGECILIDTIQEKTKYGTNIRTTDYKMGDIIKITDVDLNKKVEPEANTVIDTEEQEFMNQLTNSINQAFSQKELDKTEEKNIEKSETINQYKLKVAGIANNIGQIIGLKYNILNGICNVIITEETAKQWGIEENEISYNLYIDTNNVNEIEEIIGQMNLELDINERLFGINWYANYSKNIYQGLLKKVMVYSFIILIAFLTVWNIFNTITSSISLRKRELAELKSLGMSNKQINKMLNLEGFFYGLDAIIYGILISLVILYLIYIFVIDVEVNIKPFPFKFADYAISVFSVYVIIFFAIIHTRKKIQNQNIIDEIKNENI